MLGRGVAQAGQDRGNWYPFARVAPYLQEADLTFGNLEGPLTDLPTRFPRVNALRGSPQMAPVLKQVGFDVMSLANNHAIDYGRPGLRQTREVLQAAGITPVGAGSTLAEAEQGVLIEVGMGGLLNPKVPVGFIAYSHFPYTDFVHDPQRESILMLNKRTLRRTIRGMVHRCAILVVSFHWGKEGSTQVTNYERDLVHLAVDLGADLVVGHHAHVRGEVEEYRDALIAYCLGNLVFDEQSYGGNEGYILTARFNNHGMLVDYTVLPVRVEKCQARIDGAQIPFSVSNQIQP